MKLLLLNIVFCCALLLWGYKEGYRLNVTPSLPRGIYQLSTESPARGDIVSFCISGDAADLARSRGYLQAGSCPSGLRPLMKRLAAMPGDKVIVSEKSTSCSSSGGFCCLWPVTPLKTDRKGRPLAAAPIGGVVPDRMALVLTRHPGGFDSRYYGFVPLESLQKMEPVFTF